MRIKELYRKYKELINYGIVGGLTTVVSLAIYYGCVFTFLDAADPLKLQIANILSWIGAVTFAYFTNRVFVFESKDRHKFQEAIRFFGSRVTTLLLDMAFMFLTVSLLGCNDRIAKLADQVLVIVGNYILSKLFVFKKKKCD